MNNHLIKNFKISLLLSWIRTIVFLGAILYFTTLLESVEPTEWYDWFLWSLFLIFGIYSSTKKTKILLEIGVNENEISIISYSILKGKKEINLNVKEIIEIDCYNGLEIKFKNAEGKWTESYEINAEPWNNIYGQIKSLKLAVQNLTKRK